MVRPFASFCTVPSRREKTLFIKSSQAQTLPYQDRRIHGHRNGRWRPDQYVSLLWIWSEDVSFLVSLISNPPKRYRRLPKTLPEGKKGHLRRVVFAAVVGRLRSVRIWSHDGFRHPYVQRLPAPMRRRLFLTSSLTDLDCYPDKRRVCSVNYGKKGEVFFRTEKRHVRTHSVHHRSVFARRSPPMH